METELLKYLDRESCGDGGFRHEIFCTPLIFGHGDRGAWGSSRKTRNNCQKTMMTTDLWNNHNMVSGRTSLVEVNRSHHTIPNGGVKRVCTEATAVALLTSWMRARKMRLEVTDAPAIAPQLTRTLTKKYVARSPGTSNVPQHEA